MTYQRTRGQTILIFPTKQVTDARGNVTLVADMQATPYEVRCWIVPARSSRAEIPGQLAIEEYTVGLQDHLPNVDLWSRVRWNGQDWDVIAPPLYHNGTRKTRHWTMDIRKRPQEY